MTPDASAHRLRFGAVTPITRDIATWRDQVRRRADTGYSTILMPDVPEWQPAPDPVLAAVAIMADVRVGTWVYPFRAADDGQYLTTEGTDARGQACHVRQPIAAQSDGFLEEGPQTLDGPG